MDDVTLWRELGQQLRVDSVRAAATTKSGHPTSSMSAADLMAVLFAKYFQYDFDSPENPNNDKLVFSKGHASPLLYSLYLACGAITEEEFQTYRKLGSRLQGHPTPVIPWVDVATGSLGQGLPIAVGIALAAKKLDKLPYRVWTLCGDSEMAEGSMWEAFEHAAFWKLNNLIPILDVNRLGQRGETMHGWNLDVYCKRLEAFGWRAIPIDGHNVEEIDKAFARAVESEEPTAIVAKTKKGRGVAVVEDQDNSHGKALEDVDKAIEELGGRRNISIKVKPPASQGSIPGFTGKDKELPAYKVGDKAATRKAYGDALAALGHNRGDIVALDAEVSNSTYAEIFQKDHPDRFFEHYIAEQQMVATAVGLQVRKWNPFASTFAAFFARAYDFVRMAAISDADIKLVGSHAGVSIGEDGPSQMGLEDLACMRAVFGSTVLYPSDANQTAKLVAHMAERKGVVYMRTTREPTPVLYEADEAFQIGGSRVLRSSANDQLTIVAAGITLLEALEAADRLGQEGISAAVIDCYSIKPIDAEGLKKAAAATGRLITVEDHWPEGGLGDAVAEVFGDVPRRPLITRLAVGILPGSAKPKEQLGAAGIDADHIVKAARHLAGQET